MKPNNLIDYRKISNITSNDKNIVAQSTKMDFDENTYKNELWRYSKNTWKKFKGSKANNFSMPQYSNNKKVVSYIKSTKKSKKITISSLCPIFTLKSGQIPAQTELHLQAFGLQTLSDGPLRIRAFGARRLNNIS